DSSVMTGTVDATITIQWKNNYFSGTRAAAVRFTDDTTPTAYFNGKYTNQLSIPAGIQQTLRLYGADGRRLSSVDYPTLTVSGDIGSARWDGDSVLWDSAGVAPDSTGTLTAKAPDGSSFTLDIEVVLPDYGFYSAPRKTAANYLGAAYNNTPYTNEYDANGGDTVYYFGAVTGSDLKFYEAASDNTNVEVDYSAGTYIAVKLKDPSADSMETATVSCKGNYQHPSGAVMTMTPSFRITFTPAVHRHTLTKTAAKEPTCLEPGNIEYYACSDCGKYFKLPDLPYKADEELTRANAAQVIASCFDLPKSSVNNFSDVDSSIPEYEAILACDAYGILYSTTQGAYTFSPDDPITGWQLVILMMRASGIRNLTGQAWMIEAAKWARQNKLVSSGFDGSAPARLCDFDFSGLTDVVMTEITQADTVVAATDHDWDEWTVTKAATQTADGERTRVCKNDASHKETEPIPATGNSDDDPDDPADTSAPTPAAVSETVTAADAADGTATLSTEVTAAATSAAATEISIDVPDGAAPVKVEIPVRNVSEKDVVVLVKADGTEEIVPKTAMTDKGLVIEVTGDVKVKVVEKEAPFTDVPAGWAGEAVDFVAARGLFVGVSATEFAPNDTINRAMIATVLYRMESEPGVSAAAGFSDVAAGQWYSDAIAWASEKGIVEGYGTSFGTTDPVTREQIAVMLWRMAGKPTAADVSTGASAWAADAMSWAVGAGLIGGDGSGYNAQDAATRAEAAAIVMRYINL
ncbi:MAG: S-layer homology domain-containing protein, partial [Oscillospiraceae bacterium]|nr:S-layer homology domain-containing protein [Oscillospiraceae bacterium]